MDLLTFISNSDRKAALARRLDRSPAYLYQLATGWTPKGGKPKRPSIELAIAIERETRAIGPAAVAWKSLLPEVYEAFQSLGEAANDDAPPAKGNGAGGEGG